MIVVKESLEKNVVFFWIKKTFFNVRFQKSEFLTEDQKEVIFNEVIISST